MSHVPGEIVSRPAEDLQLDVVNPRLPEELQGRPASEVLIFMYEHQVLEELAQSFLDNGFFQHEPLIVVEEAGETIVVEGNRRLAALTILLQLPLAREVELDFDLAATLGPDRRAELESVPCWIAPDRDAVRRFLGFRHIGGIKTWSAEAKARYLSEEIDRALADGSDEPFRQVGRRVGSNALGVRNPYLALQILRAARDEFSIDTRYVQRERFGVWTRCMNAKELKTYIGVGDPRTHTEVKEAVLHLDAERLGEVIGDLTPQDGQKSVVGDSRDVTLYAAILGNEEAHALLRKHDDLELAGQVVADASLPTRIQNIVDRLDILTRDVHRTPEPGALVTPVEELYGRASTLRAAVKARLDDASS